jgi:hypothetical protein
VGYPHIQYFDQGADIYEVTRSISRKYDLTYPASTSAAAARVGLVERLGRRSSSRMFRLVRGYHWNVARDIAYYRGALNDASFAVYARSDNALGPTHRDPARDVRLLRPRAADARAGLVRRVSTSSSPAEADRSTPELARRRIQIFDADDGVGRRRLQRRHRRRPLHRRRLRQRQGGSLDYQSYANREGASMEKNFAAIMLTDTRPTFSSITRNLYLDGREFQVNFFDRHPQRLDRLLGGIMSEDWADRRDARPRAPAAGCRGHPAAPCALPRPIPTRPDGLQRALPQLRVPAAAPDGHLLDAVLVAQHRPHHSSTRCGSSPRAAPRQVDIPENERIRFFNPETGIIYVARRYGADPGLTALTGGVMNAPVDRGIASRMIQHANALLAAAFRVQSTNPDGSHVMARDTAGALIPVDANLQVRARAITAYRNYVGLVDAVRNISRLLGYGLLR